MPPPETLADAQRSILLDCLEARLVLCNLRWATASFELGSPFLAAEKERAKLEYLRDAALVEWGEVMTQIEALKTGDFPA